MDARELRPGNNVIYKPTGNIVTVLYAGPKEWAFETTWEWNESAQEELQEIEWLSMEAAEPIPLTPEILHACGSKMLGVHKEFVITVGETVDGEIQIHYSEWTKECYALLVLTTGQPVSISGRFKYLHQLQNLVYFLTGSELQIDLIKVKA